MQQSIIVRDERPACPEARGVEVELNAARAMLMTFADYGVRVAFGIPGGLVSPIFDAIADVPAIELITSRHEGMAAFSAMGHAVATGTPALVLTTSGPGITNVITGLAAAFAEEIPLILIAGEVAARSAGRGAVQDSSSSSIDIVSMLRTVTRWSAHVDDAAGAVGAARRALHMATTPRPGPVFLSVPVDVANAKTFRIPMSVQRSRRSIAPADGAICAQVADRLARAKRPLFIAGNGARSAARELRLLAERLGVPVVTTPHGKGVFPESHPLHRGLIGFAGHPSASAYLASRPDVVCIVGSRLGDVATNGWTLPIAGSEATIQIDRDPLLIGRNCQLTLGIVADAAAALRGIDDALPSLDIPPPPPPNLEESGSHAIGMSCHYPELLSSDDVPLKPARVLARLQEDFPDAFWACDQGEHTAYALHYLRIDGPDQFRAMLGLGSMGNGIGLGIGYRHARRDRPVICICGDGGFAMHAGEILTCVEHGIDLMMVVMNDGRYNMVNHGFQSVFGRVPGALPSLVADIATVAKGFGALSLCITKPADLDVVPHMARAGRPLVLDVRIDPTLALSVGSRSATLQRAAFGGAL